MAGQSLAYRIAHQGYVDLDLELSELFSGGFTLAAWVMPEFTFNHESAIFGVNGLGRFMIGQGDYRDGNGGYLDKGDPVFLFQIDKVSRRYQVPNYAKRQWNHIALVRYASVASAPDIPVTSERWYYALYVNGEKLTPFKSSEPDSESEFSPDSTPFTTTFIPDGNLRLGRTNTPDQPFHGLIDEVAAYRRAMTSSDIPSLMKKPLTSDPDLIGGWTFDPQINPNVIVPGYSSALTRGHKGSNATTLLPVAKPRGDSESSIFDDPDHVSPSPMIRQLPFPPNEIWFVVQNPDSAAGSHNGYAAYSWDFVRVDDATCKRLEGNHHVSAATGGKVVNVKDEAGGGGKVHVDSTNQLLQSLGHAPMERELYLHMGQGSFASLFPPAQPLPSLYDPSTGVSVASGDKIGATEEVEVHLHFGVSELSDTEKVQGGNPKNVMGKPIAFSDYWTTRNCDDEATWTHVERGMPRSGDYVRRHE